MKWKSFSFGFMFLFVATQVSVAQNVKLIKGQILTDSLHKFQVNIINLTAKTGTVSDEKGFFKIKVNLKDSLLFSSIGFKPEQIQITNQIIKTGKLTIALKPAVNVLKEVHIENSALTGDLVNDVSKMKGIEKFDQEKLGFPKVKQFSTFERRLFTATTGGGIIPIDPIINAISGRTKMLKRQIRYERIEKQRALVLQKLPISFFTDHLKIPENLINNFIYFCIDSKEYNDIIRKNDLLEIVKINEKMAQRYHQKLQEQE